MSIESVFEELGIPFIGEGHHHCREGWIQIDCPYCSPNSEAWRMGYNIAFHYVNCWSCGRHELVEALSGASGALPKTIIPLLKGINRDAFREKSDLPKTGKYKIPIGVVDILPAHRNYLINRGFDSTTKLETLWGIKGIGIAPRYQWSLFIPIIYHGSAVSWTTRTIGKEVRLRYDSAPHDHESLNHKTLLYGEDYVRGSAIVVEGPIDAWKIGPGAVATFGTSFTQAQVARLAKIPRRVICFDNETEAQMQAKNLCNYLEGMPGETFNVVLESGKDAGEASKKEIKELRKRFLQ